MILGHKAHAYRANMLMTDFSQGMADTCESRLY